MITSITLTEKEVEAVFFAIGNFLDYEGTGDNKIDSALKRVKRKLLNNREGNNQ